MRTTIIAVLIMTASSIVYAQSCECGPDYCLGDSRYVKKLASKKASLAKDYPGDLVALLDRDGACVARVEQAPDSISLMTVGPNGSKTIIAWDDDNERISRQQILDGRAAAYYKFNAARAFACCKEPKFDERADWDASLGINTGLAIACKKAAAGIACK